MDLFNMNGKHERNVCKKCRKLQQRLYYEQNKEKIHEDKKKYREVNREHDIVNREKKSERRRESIEKQNKPSKRLQDSKRNMR